jgi:threonylcarbamoyladenosine tRNA methylthiotransferase MtaB
MDIKRKRVAAVTLGCKLNYAETSAILEKFIREGWELSSIDEDAELVIIHTCAVTGQAEQKSRQKVRKIIRKYPKSTVAVIGCYAQLAFDKLSLIDGVSVILGTSDKFLYSNYEMAINEDISLPLVRISSIAGSPAIYAGHSLLCQRDRGRTRAFLKIQDGCSHGCSYCTIPLIRGRSRSLDLRSVMDTARKIAAAGYREIVLTGVNIADYRDGDIRFPDLLSRLESLDIDRIRIGSVEPDLLDEELIDVVASSGKIMPHFHLPLQSGSDAILRAMGRHYTTSMYREKLLSAIRKIPDCAIGADVMVGFPGESDDHFQEMYRFISELPLAYLHVFSCSIRPGTVLASRVSSGQARKVAPTVAAERSRLLSMLGADKERFFASSYSGKDAEVLFEEFRDNCNGSYRGSGYTRNYLRVMVEPEKGITPESLRGKACKVRLGRLGDDLYLRGRLLF